MHSSKIAAVGDFDSISIFRSMGVRVYVVDENQEDRSYFEQVLKEGYQIVFLTERLGEKWRDLLKEVETRIVQTVVLIPDQKGKTGFAMGKVRETVKNAIGADILKEN
jgi:V/A-type H+-transporting ATPase subunit F